MPKDTPLIDFHKRHAGRIVDFAGWNLPVLYTGIIEEHKAVRNATGLFDVSHMGQALIEGAGALDFLNASLTNTFSKLEIGAAKYSVFCYENGTCVDDVIVYRIGSLSYLIVLNASNIDKDISRLKELSAGCDVVVEDVSDKYALLAVQGKTSIDMASKVLGSDLSTLRRFHTRQSGSDFLISRTGYTGSDGVEIFCPPSKAEELAEKFVQAGAALCGLGARDSLRMEAHYPLYGHEISDTITPLEAGLGWAVKLDKNFVGRDALAAQKAAGLKRRVAWFKAEGKRIVRPGTPLFSNGSQVGTALSGAWSGLWECPIGSAMLAVEDPKKQEIYADIRGSKEKIFIL